MSTRKEKIITTTKRQTPPKRVKVKQLPTTKRVIELLQIYKFRDENIAYGTSYKDLSYIRDYSETLRHFKYGYIKAWIDCFDTYITARISGLGVMGYTPKIILFDSNLNELDELLKTAVQQAKEKNKELIQKEKDMVNTYGKLETVLKGYTSIDYIQRHETTQNAQIEALGEELVITPDLQTHLKFHEKEYHISVDLAIKMLKMLEKP